MYDIVEGVDGGGQDVAEDGGCDAVQNARSAGVDGLQWTTCKACAEQERRADRCCWMPCAGGLN